MRHRKVISICSVGFVAAIAIYLWSRDDAEPPSKKGPKMPLFSVSFQGYSNSLGGEKWGVLLITNRDVHTLSLDAPVRVRFLDHPDLEARQLRWGVNPLPRGASSWVAVQIPPASGAWSFQCCVLRCTWQEEVAERLPGWLARWVPGPGVSARADVNTGWIPQ